MGWIPEGGVKRLSQPSSVASSPVSDGHDDGAGSSPPAPDVDSPIGMAVSVSLPLTFPAPARRKYRLFGAVCVSYFFCSGGIYGIEPAAKTSAPLFVFITFLAMALLFAFPLSRVRRRSKVKPRSC